MKFFFDKRVLIGFGITMLVLLIPGVFSYSRTQRLIDRAGPESHATCVVNTAEWIVKAMIDMETGQQVFLITGNEGFLKPFNESSKVVASYLNIPDSLTAENIRQQTKIDILKEAYYPKIDEEAKRITDVIIRNTARMNVWAEGKVNEGC